MLHLCVAGGYSFGGSQVQECVKAGCIVFGSFAQQMRKHAGMRSCRCVLCRMLRLRI